MTGRADIPQSAFAVAAGAGQAEFPCARPLRAVSSSIACGARGGGAAHRSRAAAGFTSFLADNIEPYLRAPDGFPEIDIATILRAPTFLGPGRGALASSASEELAENVVKTTGSLLLSSPPVHVLREIEAAKPHAWIVGSR